MLLLAVLTSLLTMLQSQRLESDFALTMAADQSQAMTYQGSFVMEGALFRVTLLDIEAAYDGQTLYMFSEDTKELTLSTPTEEELIQTNPFLYVQALLPESSVSESDTKEGTLIILVPKDVSAGITRFTLSADHQNVPQRLEIKEKDKQTTMRLTNPRWVEGDKDGKMFVIHKEGVFINDLR